MAKANPMAYEPDVAITQNNLGGLYTAQNAPPIAEAAYIKALKIYRRLAKDNPQDFEPSVAMVQNNLGGLYTLQNDYPRAEAAYTERPRNQEASGEGQPDGIRTDVAAAQNKPRRFVLQTKRLPKDGGRIHRNTGNLQALGKG
ncbi:MAG: tetratricopeptide repeat protein [Saprospiraceae bacterium]|nr:tetratricopeptide repeat protein [Saprospiraceae bacterium]